MTAWTSWAVVCPDELKDKVLAVEGVLQGRDVVQGRDVALFTGTLDEFSTRWEDPFVVHTFGRYIKVGETV